VGRLQNHKIKWLYPVYVRRLPVAVNCEAGCITCRFVTAKNVESLVSIATFGVVALGARNCSWAGRHKADNVARAKPKTATAR
jgi:hypothetical protein